MECSIICKNFNNQLYTYGWILDCAEIDEDGYVIIKVKNDGEVVHTLTNYGDVPTSHTVGYITAMYTILINQTKQDGGLRI